jgi:hypothetical protein
MKRIRQLIIPFALASLFTQPVLAGPEFAEPDATAVAAAFAGSDELPSSLALLSDAEMAATEGRFAPLGLALAIASVDIALIGVFWGVYVPYYGSSGALPENP